MYTIQQLIKASKGYTAAAGGLNRQDIIKYLLSVHINTENTQQNRQELNHLLHTHLVHTQNILQTHEQQPLNTTLTQQQQEATLNIIEKNIDKAAPRATFYDTSPEIIQFLTQLGFNVHQDHPDFIDVTWENIPQYVTRANQAQIKINQDTQAHTDKIYKDIIQTINQAKSQRRNTTQYHGDIPTHILLKLTQQAYNIQKIHSHYAITSYQISWKSTFHNKTQHTYTQEEQDYNTLATQGIYTGDNDCKKLAQAYKAWIRKNHPDKNTGTHTHAQMVIDAYGRLCK